MFLIREAQPDDADMLLKLAKTSHFVNLPPAKDIIEDKIAKSRESLEHLAGRQRSRHRRTTDAFDGPIFMFSIEDTETGHCLGTSMVISRMGGPGHPNVAFKLDKRDFFSSELHIGTSTQTIQLELDESGPTEIGGLILSPAFRRHPSRVGKQLSMVRFHFIGLHRSLFAPKLLAEMMAPITADGHSPFWEYVGRRFINLTYEEAYRFSQRSRDFMFELLPREPIYISLLPPEARRVIGAVGPDTIPAVKLLESLGFTYNGKIDPFDGGPHLEAPTNAVPLVRDSALTNFAGTCSATRAKHHGFVSHLSADGRFRALHTSYASIPDGGICLPKPAAETLLLDQGDPIGVTPYDLAAPPPATSIKRPTNKKKPARTRKPAA